MDTKDSPLRCSCGLVAGSLLAMTRLDRNGPWPRHRKDPGSGRPTIGWAFRTEQSSPGRRKGAATSTLAQAVMGRNRFNRTTALRCAQRCGCGNAATLADSKWAENLGSKVQAVRRRPVAASRTAPYSRVRCSESSCGRSPAISARKGSAKMPATSSSRTLRESRTSCDISTPRA